MSTSQEGTGVGWQSSMHQNGCDTPENGCEDRKRMVEVGINSTEV